MRASDISKAALLAGLLTVLHIPLAQAQSIIHVDQSATGADNGTSWVDALTSLQDALVAAQNGDEVWVAAGTYRPDQGVGITPGDREESFYIPGGISLFGGFDTSEQARDERDWIANETILSGDLLENDNEVLSFDSPLRLDNSYHVVRMEGVTESVVLDGFTITDGMAVGIPLSRGSAIWIRTSNILDPSFLVRISNCTVEKNVSIAGNVIVDVYPPVDDPMVVFENSTVRNNLGVTTAGISVWSGTTVIKNVVFEENAAGDAGAVNVTLSDEDVYIIGCVISNNSGNYQVSFTVDEAETNTKTLYMWNTMFVGNSSESGTVKVGNGNLLSVNNVFSGNTGDFYSSAMFLPFSDAQIVNNVFAFNNMLTGNGGIISLWDSSVSISNSIFWGNTSPEDLLFHVIGSEQDNHVVLSHSIIQNELPSFVTNAGGLLTGDPLFWDASGTDNVHGTIDDDFRLLGLSPAIDSGDNSSLPLDTFDVDGDGDTDEAWPKDFVENMRSYAAGTGPAIVDMGIFEFDAPPIVSGLVYPPESISFSTGHIEAYPIPTKDRITVTWNLPLVPHTRMDLYDVSGRRIRTLFEGGLMSGDTVTLDVSGLTSGLYFVRDYTTHATAKILIRN